MDFSKAVKQYKNYTRTENNSVALKTTESALLDLFATVGTLRQKDAEHVAQAFGAALAEDKLLATKLAFYTRNIRGGLGERSTFRKMIVFLAQAEPEIIKLNIDLIPHFGRFDDWYSLVGTSCEDVMWDALRRQLEQDLANMHKGESVSLLAKWMKSVNTSSAKSRRLGKLTAQKLDMSEKAYRKMLSKLRAHIDVVEKKMSRNEWSEIDHEAVPSYAMKNYRRAFFKHTPEAFETFIDEVKTGEKTIKASTLYPYDIFMGANVGWGGWRTSFEMEQDDVLQAQWDALPNYVGEGKNVLVMADTSASMNSENGLPMATSVSLAIYFAERNKGAYHNMFLTFSRRPTFVHLEDDMTLAEKVAEVPSIVDNTDLEKAFALILDVAIANNVSQDEMPVSLVVISDMHFDEGTSGSHLDTFHHKMKKKFADAGYEMPTLIYWNVATRASIYHTDKDEQNAILVSGHSASTFRDVISNIGRTPYDFMVETLNNPMYDVVRV
jgi:hypothetical protein